MDARPEAAPERDHLHAVMKGQIMSEDRNGTGEIEWLHEHAEVERASEHVGQPVFLFEGEPVTEMEGRLPAVTFDMPEGYPRGTILRVVTEYRVRNVRYEENRKGDLVRQHIMTLQSIELAGAYNPAFVNDTVVGELAGRPPREEPQPDEQMEELHERMEELHERLDGEVHIKGQTTIEEQIEEISRDEIRVDF